MTKYLYVILSVIFCGLALACGVLYGANAKLKAEIHTLDEALETCMESGRALASNAEALKKQLQEQERVCREQVKRTQQVYYNLMLDERQACSPKNKPFVSGVSPDAHPLLHKAGEPQIPPPHNKNDEVQDRLPYQVVSYEKSTDAVNLLNDTFRVFGGDSLQSP